jgi:hypothetical protein
MEPNQRLAEETGKPEFTEIECISIIVPGSSNEHVSIVTDEYKDRFKAEYAAWKAVEGAPISGMPMTEWPLASNSFVEQMKLHGIRSVEDLANASDTVTARDPGMMTMRAKAQAWLAAASDAALTTKAVTEVDALKARIAELESAAASKPRHKAAEPAPAPEPDAMTDEELERLTAP